MVDRRFSILLEVCDEDCNGRAGPVPAGSLEHRPAAHHLLGRTLARHHDDGGSARRRCLVQCLPPVRRRLHNWGQGVRVHENGAAIIPPSTPQRRGVVGGQTFCPRARRIRPNRTRVLIAEPPAWVAERDHERERIMYVSFQWSIGVRRCLYVGEDGTAAINTWTVSSGWTGYRNISLQVAARFLLAKAVQKALGGQYQRTALERAALIVGSEASAAFEAAGR